MKLDPDDDFIGGLRENPVVPSAQNQIIVSPSLQGEIPRWVIMAAIAIAAYYLLKKGKILS
jgi:hypothetical protein